MVTPQWSQAAARAAILASRSRLRFLFGSQSRHEGHRCGSRRFQQLAQKQWPSKHWCTSPEGRSRQTGHTRDSMSTSAVSAMWPRAAFRPAVPFPYAVAGAKHRPVGQIDTKSSRIPVGGGLTRAGLSEARASCSLDRSLDRLARTQGADRRQRKHQRFSECNGMASAGDLLLPLFLPLSRVRFSTRSSE